MNEAQHARFSGYIRQLGDLLGLQDWEIELEWQHDDDPEVGASCGLIPGRKVAGVRLGQDWESETPQAQRHYCVHELLHCHTAPVQAVVQHVKGRLGSDAFDILWGAHSDAIEYAIDGIAAAIAGLLPLPPGDPSDADIPADVLPFRKRDVA